MGINNFRFVRYTIGLPATFNTLKFEVVLCFMVEQCEETRERRITAIDREIPNVLKSIEPLIVPEENWKVHEEFCSSNDTKEWQAFVKYMGIE